LKESQNVKVGKTWKKKFFIAMLSGFLALGGLISVFGFSGTVFALPLGGIGDFFVEFDELKGEGFQLLPNIGETGNSDAAPMVRNKMEKATITGLHIYKDLKLPTGNWIRIHVHAEGEATITGLIQDARFINADLGFEELAIMEKNTEDYTQNWTQQAGKVNIKNAKIVTDYLFQTMVSLEGTKISIESIDGPEIIDE
jgi:hypothetical protein